MKKVINETDVRNASDIERCKFRKSNIYTRYKNTLKGE